MKFFMVLCWLLSLPVRAATSLEEVQEKINQKKAVLIDLREIDEISPGMLQKSLWMPDFSPENAVSFIQKHFQSNKDIFYFLYCRYGKRSKALALTLNQLGYRAESIGLYDQLKTQGFPIETGEAVLLKKVRVYKNAIHLNSGMHLRFLKGFSDCLKKENSLSSCADKIPDVRSYMDRRLRTLEVEKNCLAKKNHRLEFVMGCFRREAIKLCVLQNGQPPLGWHVYSAGPPIQSGEVKKFNDDKIRIKTSYRAWQKKLVLARSCMERKSKSGCEGALNFLKHDIETKEELHSQDMACVDESQGLMQYMVCAMKISIKLSEKWVGKTIP